MIEKKKREVGTILAATWLILLTILAFTADYLPFIRGYAESSPDGIAFGKGPFTSFLFGSDQLGRDVFARCIYGAQISLRIAIFSIIIGTLVGGTLGMVAGFLERRRTAQSARSRTSCSPSRRSSSRFSSPDVSTR